jgi:DNA primase
VIPSNFVQDLLSRVDIVEVVGRHVQLKKAGINHKGLCPFHGEKTPSFSVSATRQTYHCFGCGVHGNAIGFLMEHGGIGFLDAVRDLAQQVGVTVPEDDRTPREREQAAEAKARQATLSDVLLKAADHYRKQLKAAPRAVDYLKGRGLTGEIAATFGLGYAPDGWRGLASVFPHYDDPLLEESGLVIASGEENSADRKRYDRFRDRIMFPIRSVQGEVIGFGGRVLDKGEPKYLNSPETAVFVKGRELYGLHEARAGLRKRGHALVVEGYMDVVALAQLGFPNAVATLGTACSAEHVQKLFRFTDSVVFSFDGDLAGRRAAGRALEACLPHATDTRSVRFLFLPAEHDPDSYVREHGAEAFEKCIEQAIPLSRQLIEAAREGCDTQSAEGRAKLLATARPWWNALPEGALKMQLLGDLAAAASLTPADLGRLWQTSRPAPREAPREPEEWDIPDGRGEREDEAPRRPATQGRPPWRGKKSRFDTPAPHQEARLRSAPLSPADSALRLLLLHGDWWERLDTDDHELLHGLSEPHGALCAWLERYLLEHGAPSWAVCQEALQDTDWVALATRLVPPDVLEDEMQFADLRRVLDGMWVERLKLEQERLIAQAASDPSALARWREIDEHIRRRRESMKLPTSA